MNNLNTKLNETINVYKNLYTNNPTILIISLIISGILIGGLYFYSLEKFDNNSLPNKCWFMLHYLNKINSPLYLVHFKSIMTGIILILCAYYKYYKVIIFLGSCIIGLHIAQFTNEYNIINNNLNSF